MGTLVTDLEPGRTLIETHISWVLLDADCVYKIKKPVDFGFLDFTTLDKRHAACLTEVELNSRLTRDVYLGVKPITRDRNGVHSIAGNGEVVDYCVHMRRLSEHDRLDSRLQNGDVSPELVQRLAVHLAAFHARCATTSTIARFGEIAVIRRNVEENFEQVRTHLTEFMSSDAAQQLERAQLEFLERNAGLFAARVTAGRIRDGHGDLRLEHIYVAPDHFEVLDCIEFNDRFRYADVACDLAFATMELRAQNRADLAEILIAAYAANTHDFSLYGLVDFYESYRAVVRAKVNAFVALDATACADTRRSAHDRASHLFARALASLEPRRPGRVIAVGGLIATGKSHVSARLSGTLVCPVVSSDRVRKHLLRVDPHTNVATAPFAGAYSETTTQRTYEMLRTYAADVLKSGRPVVLDATFRSSDERRALQRWCAELGSQLSFVECVAPHDTLRKRLQQREQSPSVSDGREDLLDSFMAKYEAPNELPPSARCRLDTTLPEAEQSRILTAFLERPE